MRAVMCGVLFVVAACGPPNPCSGHQFDRQRRYSLPPGAVRDQWVQRLREEARRLLPPQFVALVEHTGQPFVQAILDLSVTKMAFGRVCLLGDAAFVPRPHTAASTSKAIGNALDLARAFANHPGDIEEALTGWEVPQISLGRHLVQQGQFLGRKCCNFAGTP